MTLQSDTARAGAMKGVYRTAHAASAPGTWYLALFTDSTMATELTTTGGIGRVSVTNVDANWAVDTHGVVTNLTAISSASATSAWSASATFGALMDASTGGNAWDGGALATPIEILSVGDGFTIPAGALSMAA